MKRFDKEKRSMKRGILLVMIIAFMAIFVWFGQPALGQETKGPKLVIPEGAFDFKEVMEGEVIRHAFLVYNKGSETLEIQKVSPG